jgi:TRAP-type C4-dicarboxylate transport system permease small subunit
MTQAFIIVLRLLCLALLGYFGYRLWNGTRSWTTRSLAGLFVGALAWQIIVGAW